MGFNSGFKGLNQDFCRTLTTCRSSKTCRLFGRACFYVQDLATVRKFGSLQLFVCCY